MTLSPDSPIRDSGPRNEEDSTPVAPFHRWIKGGVLAAGLLLSILLLTRAQATGDQFELLARGWLLVQQGEWVHYGSPTSSAGFNADCRVEIYPEADPLPSVLYR